MQLGGGIDDPFPEASLPPTKGEDDKLLVEATAGPVQVRTEGRRELWWNVRANEPGYHRLVFVVGGRPVEKELAAGEGAMRVSPLRPGWNWWDALTHPSEAPFGRDSAVQSIEIDYPGRDSPAGAGESWATYWFSWSMAGAGWLGSWTGLPAWMIYWFVVSLIVGLCLSRVFKVNV